MSYLKTIYSEDNPEFDVLYCDNCWDEFDGCDPHIALKYKDAHLCQICFEKYIYEYADWGGGLFNIWLLRDAILQSSVPRRRRKQISKKLRIDVFKTYKSTCVKCSETDPNKLTIDHIVPVFHGGKDTASNLQVLCRSCNSKKHIKSNEEFMSNE